jgi:hypothetical protein
MLSFISTCSLLYRPAWKVFAELIKPPSKPTAIESIRAGLLDLLNDPDLTDRTRLRQLEQLREEIEGFIFDLRARLPGPRSRRGERDGDPPRI